MNKTQFIPYTAMKCPVCGADIKPGEGACEYCGTRFRKVSDTATRCDTEPGVYIANHCERVPLDFIARHGDDPNAEAHIRRKILEGLMEQIEPFVTIEFMDDYDFSGTFRTYRARLRVLDEDFKFTRNH